MKFISFTLLILVVASLSALLYTQNQIKDLNSAHQNEVLELQNKISQQRKDKDTIRAIWERQAASNDNLIKAQASSTKEVELYRSLVGRSIRFVGGEAQVYPDVIEKDFIDSINALELQQSNLELLIRQTIKEKQDSTTEINSLYLNSGEDQNNRANPRDGVR